MASSHPACCSSDHLPDGKPIQNLSYAGEIAPADAFAYIAAHGSARLVDVRTPQEWEQGVPDLGAQLVTVSWKIMPDYTLNPAFGRQFAAHELPKDAPLFFMCRGGGRSLDAAIAMTQAGYLHCYNVTGGFEGKADAPGWKTSQLPWKRG